MQVTGAMTRGSPDLAGLKGTMKPAHNHFHRSWVGTQCPGRLDELLRPRLSPFAGQGFGVGPRHAVARRSLVEVDQQRSSDATVIGRPARTQPTDQGRLISVGPGLPAAGDPYYVEVGVSERRETPTSM